MCGCGIGIQCITRQAALELDPDPVSDLQGAGGVRQERGLARALERDPGLAPGLAPSPEEAFQRSAVSVQGLTSEPSLPPAGLHQ